MHLFDAERLGVHPLFRNINTDMQEQPPLSHLFKTASPFSTSCKKEEVYQ
jgi:hypothetical protein